MKTWARVLLVVLTLNAITILPANAGSSVLLGQTSEINVGGTWSGGVQIPPTIIGMQFFVSLNSYNELFTNASYDGGTYGKVNELLLTNALGGSLYLSKGQTGIYDFPITNNVSFSNLVSAILTGTNTFTTNSIFCLGGIGYNTDRIETAGIGYGGVYNNEIWGLPSGPLPAGSKIDSFRLIVSSVNWGYTNGGFQVTGIGQWQVYGETNQVALTIIPYGSNLILEWPTNATGFTLQFTTNLNSLASWGTFFPGPVVIGGENAVFSPINGNQMYFRLIK